MAPGENGSSSDFQYALDALSSLITKRSRVDNNNQSDRFDLLFDYLKVLELEESISQMKVIHVAGTKGKGSTCTFTESILRNCGFTTGLFTSPHLIDVRERFRLNGIEISQKKFLEYFWWCYNKLKAKTNDELPMPAYFRFLALLAFKIFTEEQVDVVILEVGLGGRLDATNVVQKPIVCGISSLGYDHMEILGDTLAEIAAEKAGIFKRGVPAITVPQTDEAMRVLEEKASKLDVKLQVARPLDKHFLKGHTLRLQGEHQYLNAGLAVALCSTWLQETCNNLGAKICLNQTDSLPEQFITGLITAYLAGRAQIVPDRDNPEDIVFYLDGAHSPESMEVCGKWFSLAVRPQRQKKSIQYCNNGYSESSNKQDTEMNKKMPEQILLFNCMSIRDPQLLLPRLRSTCADHGVVFKKAIFVPSISAYNKVGSAHPPSSNDPHVVDSSWQFTLQSVWGSLVRGGEPSQRGGYVFEDEKGRSGRRRETSTVFSSLPSAINWLRQNVRHNRSLRLQVLVTGSLHLVGDVLRLIKK